jgi:hypothetical protein
MRISADYIIWAHGPAAEDGVYAAMVLVNHANQAQRNERKFVLIEPNESVRDELIQVARLYDWPEFGNRQRQARRILNTLEESSC